MKHATHFLILALLALPTTRADETQNLQENYEALRVYQETPNFLSFGNEDEIRVDLNGDGRRERLLLTNVHAHYGNYSIFTYRHKKWKYIGDVGVGGYRPRLAKKTRRGWHDFSIDTDSTRNQKFRNYYHWNKRSKMYEEDGSIEIRPMDPDPEALLPR